MTPEIFQDSHLKSVPGGLCVFSVGWLSAVKILSLTPRFNEVGSGVAKVGTALAVSLNQ